LQLVEGRTCGVAQSLESLGLAEQLAHGVIGKGQVGGGVAGLGQAAQGVVAVGGFFTGPVWPRARLASRRPRASRSKQVTLPGPASLPPASMTWVSSPAAL
jgi:hypothetical protein